MLELGRVDAWFTGVPEGLYLWPKSNNRLQMSPVLASTDLYLACSKDCDAQLQEDLRKAVAALSAEGMIQRIQETYQPER